VRKWRAPIWRKCNLYVTYTLITVYILRDFYVLHIFECYFSRGITSVASRAKNLRVKCLGISVLEMLGAMIPTTRRQGATKKAICVRISTEVRNPESILCEKCTLFCSQNLEKMARTKWRAHGTAFPCCCCYNVTLLALFLNILH
jgi:hypothetical protein